MSQKHILIFHGSDPYVIREQTAPVLAAIPAGMEDMALIRLSGDKCELGEVLDQLSMPAFGSPVKVVWVREYQKLRKQNALQLMLEQLTPDVCLILEQEEVKPLSPSAQKWMQARQDAAVFILYPPDEREMKKRAFTFFKSKGRQLSDECLAFIGHQLALSPGVLMTELEKLELFLHGVDDSAVTVGMLEPLLSAESEGNLFFLIETFVRGNVKASLDVFLQTFAHHADLIPFAALLTNELYRRIQFLEGLQSGLSAEALLPAIGVYHFRAKEQYKKEKPENLECYYGLLRESLELETILKSDSLMSEGADQVRISLPARAHFLKMLFYFSGAR